MSKRPWCLFVLLTLLWQHMWASLLVLERCETGESLGLNKSRLVELSVESSLDYLNLAQNKQQILIA